MVLAATAAERAEFVVFVVLAPVAVLAALGMVLNRNAIYSALLLVVNFFCLAVLYVLLEAQFIAAVQVIVYAGAIMVLFLFVLMLLGVERREVLEETIRGQRTAAAVLGALLLAGITWALLAGVFDTPQGGLAAANRGGNVQAVGRLLFTRYTLAFEATGALLLVAGVGALILGRRQRHTPEPESSRSADESQGHGRTGGFGGRSAAQPPDRSGEPAEGSGPRQGRAGTATMEGDR
jgi:NADH-quinone oxidoreductase subunit J